MAAETESRQAGPWRLFWRGTLASSRDMRTDTSSSCSDDAAFLRDELGVATDGSQSSRRPRPMRSFSPRRPPCPRNDCVGFCTLSQFAFVKAPAVAAGAMSRLARIRPDLRFTWVCARAHHADVRALLGDTPVELLDWMPVDALRDVYDAHGIFLFTSYFEGFGKVFLEAMSRGLCVVSTRAGGAPDLIGSADNGLLVPVGDPGAVAEAAESLLTDFAAAKQISKHAAETARAHTWSRVGRDTAAFYERLFSLA